MNNREFIQTVSGICEQAFANEIGFSQAFTDVCALVNAEALKPSHNKQSTQNYACPKCNAWLSTIEYRTGECHSCHSSISA
jgi:hypothetical protein